MPFNYTKRKLPVDNTLVRKWFEKIRDAIIFETEENAQKILDKKYPGFRVKVDEEKAKASVFNDSGNWIFDIIYNK